MNFDSFDGGFSWFPDEQFTRTSHALATGSGVWLVDPVDASEPLERAAELGEPAGVLQLLDRHERDCAKIAARLEVPHLRVPAAVAGSPFTVVPVLKLPRWHEVALWWPERRVLVVAETIGTNKAFAVGRGPAGVHLLLRIRPPGALRGYEPEHLLVGHGRGIHGPAASAALERAYARTRKDLPALAGTLSAAARAAVSARMPR